MLGQADVRFSFSQGIYRPPVSKYKRPVFEVSATVLAMDSQVPGYNH